MPTPIEAPPIHITATTPTPIHISIPVGAPGPAGADGQAQLAAHEAAANPHPQYRPREFAIATSSAEWILNHNLGYYPVVQPLNLARQEINAEVQHISVNQVRIFFNAPITGYILYN